MKTRTVIATIGLMMLGGSALAKKPIAGNSVRTMTVARAVKQGTVVVPKAGFIRIKGPNNALFDVADRGRPIPIMFTKLGPGEYMDVGLKTKRYFTIVDAPAATYTDR